MKPRAPVLDLTVKPVLPRRVCLSRWATSPHAVINGQGRTLLDAAHGPAQLVIDFGMETVGSVTLRAIVHTPATLRLFYGEDLTEALVTVDPYPVPNWYRLPQDEFRLQPGQQTITNPGRRAFRYIHIFVAAGKLELEAVSARLVHYPVRAAGYFSCFDPLINRAWDISSHTTRLCMQQYYEDGVKRDGILWIGDYRVEYLCNALLFGDAALARKSLRMMAETQEPDGSLTAAAIRSGGHQHPFNINYMGKDLPDRGAFMDTWVLRNYCTDFVSSLREYDHFTGDVETLRALWPRVVHLLAFLRAVDARASKPMHNFITDAQLDHEGWWGSHGALAMQLLWAMRDAIALSGRVGDAATGRQCEAYVAAHEPLIRSRYYASDLRLFRDEEDGAGTSWQVNALAVLAGVVAAPHEARALFDRLQAQPKARRPMAGFMEFWMLEALWAADMVQEALHEIRRYWGHMLKYDATTTWDLCHLSWDNIDRPKTHALSHCHGWSAGPAYLLPAHVLGVQPAAPGMRRVTISPQLGDLAWAEGVVPTPHGDLFVAWESQPVLRGLVRLPAGMDGTVMLGTGDQRREVELHGGENRIDPEARP